MWDAVVGDTKMLTFHGLGRARGEEMMVFHRVGVAEDETKMIFHRSGRAGDCKMYVSWVKEHGMRRCLFFSGLGGHGVSKC